MTKIFKQFLLSLILFATSFECQGRPPFLSEKLRDDNPVWEQFSKKLRPEGPKKPKSGYPKEPGISLGQRKQVRNFGDNPHCNHAQFVKGDLAYLLGRIEKAKRNKHDPVSQEAVLPDTEDMVDLAINLGSFSARKYKRAELKKKPQGYKNAEDFNNLLITRYEDPLAMEIKLETLIAYSNPSPEIPKICDRHFSNGSALAIQCKIEGIAYGKHGYPKGTKEEVRTLVDKLFDQRNPFAIEFKLSALADENAHEKIYDYNPGLAQSLNETLITKGNQEAVSRKLQGLHNGTYGYSKSEAEESAFIDDLIQKGNPRGMYQKAVRLIFGIGMLTSAPNKAQPLLKRLSTLEYKPGIKLALTYGTPGSINCNERYLTSPDLCKKERRRKLRHLLGKSKSDVYGYKKDLEAARLFNEKLIKQGDIRAVRRKIKGLADGTYGYVQDPDAATVLFEQTFYPLFFEAVERIP